MTTAEVFAMNIQIPQLKEAIPQYEWSDKRFQEERDYFLWWLNKQINEFGYKPQDQVQAWTLYTLYHSFEEMDDEEEFTPSWLLILNTMWIESPLVILLRIQKGLIFIGVQL